MINPKVSIIIPVYNGANHMIEAIDSALAQTYDNCEVIVVNDGSIDNTEEIALSYGDKIRYYSKENGGVSTALNLGIKKMTGEYFCYLPHDDIFHSNKIQRQIDEIQKSGDEMTIVWSSYNAYYKKTGLKRKVDIPAIYRNKDFIENGITPLLFSLVNTITVIVHRKYFELFGEFDEKLFTSQDYDMWFRIFRNRKTVYIDEPLADYRYHDKQGSQVDVEFMNNCMELSKKIRESLIEKEIEVLFGTKYRFLYYMMDYYECCWNDSGYMCCFRELEDVKEQLSNMNYPTKEKKLLEKILWKYTEGNIKKVVLYCAGKNGKRLIHIMRQRQVDVFKISDSDKSKLGTIVEGIECGLLDKEDKESSLIIVTKDDPEELINKLKGEGYKYITSFDDIAFALYWMVP